MGYGAHVNCNCYKEGKVRQKPPYEEFVIEGDEGLELNLEWEGNAEKHNEFWRWLHLQNICDHVGMRYCAESLANSSGMSDFRRLCRELGEEAYPILNKYLPTANEGYLPGQFAPQLLEELTKMCQVEIPECLIVLREVKTGEVVYSTNVNYNSEFFFGGKVPYNAGVGKAGFYVVKKYNLWGYKFKKQVWASKAFTQEKDEKGRYFFRDKATGSKITIDFNLLMHQKENNDYFEFEVIEKQALIEEEYSYILEPLLRLAKASLETGNNICWT